MHSYRAIRGLGSLAALLFLTAVPAAAQTPASLPAEDSSRTIPNPLGVNIHFTRPATGELEQLRAAGFRWVRMDLSWSHVEKPDGSYDFADYDVLMDALKANGLRAVLILDYAHPNHDGNQSPHTDAGRAAFARFAVAAVKRYAGRGVLWEMYNEPNITPFWRPKPNVNDYVRLATAVGKALREAAPNEAFVGPATSGVDLTFLEACLKAGLLDHFSAVSVHPYRHNGPESAETDLRALRVLVTRYAPQGKQVPILSGEWGYSAAWNGHDEQTQGKFLARQFLFNLSQRLPLMVWYDWHDDGDDDGEPEHHFGTVRHAPTNGAKTPFDPKPAYLAAQTLAKQLDGFTFNKRLALDSPDDHLLLFSRGRDVKLAAWTTARDAKDVEINLGFGRFDVVSHTGDPLPAIQGAERTRLHLTDAPVYLTPAAGNELLALAAAWETAPLEILTEGARKQVPITLRIANVLDRPTGVVFNPHLAPARRDFAKLAAGIDTSDTLTVDVGRATPSRDVRLTWSFEGIGTLSQTTHVVVTDPIEVAPLPRLGAAASAIVRNPSGKPFAGTLRLRDAAGRTVDAPVAMKEGQTEQVATATLPPSGGDYTVAIDVLDESRAPLTTIPPARFRLIDDLSGPDAASRFSLQPSGDAKVASRQSLSAAPAPPGLPAAGLPSLKITYQFAPGWKFLMLNPAASTHASRPIEGKPAALGLWIHGDASTNAARIRFRDSAGQTFQTDGPRITWNGWRYVTFPLDNHHGTSWGGPRDNTIHYPIHLETLFLLDNASQQTSHGEVHIAQPTLVYEVSH